MLQPCEGATLELQLVNAVLAAFNIALATFLAHRRVQADRERRNGQSNGKAQSGSSDKELGDSGGPSNGPAVS